MRILKQNENLDLDKYKPFLHDFTKYSGDMFEFDTNIFPVKTRDAAEVMK